MCRGVDVEREWTFDPVQVELADDEATRMRTPSGAKHGASDYF